MGSFAVLFVNLLLVVIVYSRRLSIFEDNGNGVTDSPNPFDRDLVFGIEVNKRSDSNMLKLKLPSNIEMQILIDMRSPLNDNDFKRSKLLTAEDYYPMDNVSTFLNDPNYLEGDIAEVGKDKNAIRNPRLKWPGGQVPYVISNKYSEHSRAVIAKAIDDYHQKTCIKFVPKTETNKNYIYIYPQSGCSSEVGQVDRGMQVVSIGPGCEYVGIVEHELMHAIGFWHEQSRADRDQYIRINWQNIMPGMAYNFEKQSLLNIQHLGEKYDYKSLMHYGAYAFAKGSQPTIVPLKPGAEIGQRYSLSKTDVMKINKLYECVHYLPPKSKPKKRINNERNDH